MNGAGAVIKIEAIVSRLPDHELAIRRLSARDAAFQSLCSDFEDGAAALRRWSEAGAAYSARAEEYRELLDDLVAEILKDLDTHLMRVSQIRG